jgi:glycosyltransferase involved in cell wall biosynthesis
MKIVCLIDNLSAGGAQRQIVMLAKLLKQDGHDVTILTYYPQDFFLTKVLKYGIKYECHQVKNPILRVIRFWKVLNNGSQDIVISFLKTPSFLAEIASIPYRRWGLVVSERNAYINSDKNLFLYRIFHLLSDYVVVNSYTNKKLILSNAPWLKCVSVIYNCVDLNYFSNLCANPPKLNSIKMISVGKYSEQKNIFGLISAISFVKNSNPSLDISVDWYGDSVAGNETYFKAKEFIIKLGLMDCFKLHNRTGYILQKYKDHSVLILPSFYEGLPNVICEAMSCGLPILASNVCDNAKIVTDSENGYLFDPYDVSSISESIIKFSKLSNNKIASMSRYSRIKAENLFSESLFLNSYLEVINKVLKG